MKRNQKITRMFHEHSIEPSNYSLVINLKKIIEQQQTKIQHQEQQIQQYKVDSKIIKLN